MVYSIVTKIKNTMKIYKKKIIATSLTLLSVISNATWAQNLNAFSLQECMRYAVENNNSVKIQQNENLNAKQNNTEAIASLFPSLSAYSSLTNSYGRSIDPETNTYTNSGNLSNYYSITASLTVFDGLSNINTVKATNIRKESGEHQLQQQMDQTALSVMKLFYDALYYEQAVAITQEQLASSEQVLLLTERQRELGIKSDADVAQASAQVANDDLLLTQQQSNLDQSLLNLKEAMNYPLSEEISLTNSDTLTIQNIKPHQALEHNPEVLYARSSLEESKVNLKIAKGGYFPTVAVSAGYNTNFYKMLDIVDSQNLFWDQIKDNYGYYVGASISIPIFQGLSNRSNVKRSKNNIRIAELQLSNTELRIEKAVRDALLQRENSLKEYIGAERKITANQLSNDAMARKYKEGMVSIIDLQKSSNDLLLAKAEELRAKFNYLVQCIMISYYNGEDFF